MKFRELMKDEYKEVNGGSPASLGFVEGLGYALKNFWQLISTSSDSSYVNAKVGSY
ncbi:MAG: hypothetical protein Q8N05_04310 [Bacteroidota bacterium]|nr:hypothetical protein [Bacteroidota bacterium]